jgi:hypothetical protein
MILSIRDSTTSFLTATTLIYAIGAGITAAAGHNYQEEWFCIIDLASILLNYSSLHSPRQL